MWHLRAHGARMGRWLRTTICIGGAALGLYGCVSGPREPDPDAFITGTAFSRERIYVPPGAVFDATLVDISRPDAPPTVLGRQRLEPAGPPPFELRIPYHSGRVQPQGRYAVRASVTQEGRLLFVTDSTHPVLQDPAFRRVDVILTRVEPIRATVRAEVPLLQTYWKLLQVEDEPVDAAHAGAPEAHLVLQADELRVTGSGGCNRFLGEYALQGGALRFASLVSTLQLCLDGGASEMPYLQALRKVRSFVQQGRELELRGEDGKPLLRLQAVEWGLQPPSEEDPPMLPQ